MLNKVKASFCWFVKWLAQPLMFFIGIGAVIWAGGCGNSGYPQELKTEGYITTQNVLFDLVIWHDTRHEVTCWRTSVGISCLPDGHIKNPGE